MSLYQVCVQLNRGKKQQYCCTYNLISEKNTDTRSMPSNIIRHHADDHFILCVPSSLQWFFFLLCLMILHVLIIFIPAQSIRPSVRANNCIHSSFLIKINRIVGMLVNVTRERKKTHTNSRTAKVQAKASDRSHTNVVQRDTKKHYKK